jgi:hypothetical protein
MKMDINRIQTEVEGLEAASFKTDDGEETFNTRHQRFLAWGKCLIRVSLFGHTN